MGQDLREELQGNSERSRPTGTKDDAEARADFWSIEGDFIYHHHSEPRVQLYVPKEETFPIPLKYVDVTWTTHTSLDVLQEKRINDYWNVDLDRTSSDAWTGFTQFTILNEKLPTGYMWSGWRLEKFQATCRPDYRWSENWEKPKLDNARKLRGIYFNDREDGEYNQERKKEIGSSYGSGYAL